MAEVLVRETAGTPTDVAVDLRMVEAEKGELVLEGAWGVGTLVFGRRARVLIDSGSTSQQRAARSVVESQRGVETVFTADPVGSQASDVQEQHLFIHGELRPGYSLWIRLPVSVWQEGDEFAADQEELRVHSFGGTVAEAVRNLKGALVDHLSELIEMGDRLSPQLKQDREVMQALIRVHA